jgi:hypothetical protein
MLEASTYRSKLASIEIGFCRQISTNRNLLRRADQSSTLPATSSRVVSRQVISQRFCAERQIARTRALHNRKPVASFPTRLRATIAPEPADLKEEN